MAFGTIIGFREVHGVQKNTQKPYHFCEIAVQMAEIPSSASSGHYYGMPIEQFVAFDNALADYRPKVGDGIRYALYRQSGRVTCGFVLHEPTFDDPQLAQAYS